MTDEQPNVGEHSRDFDDFDEFVAELRVLAENALERLEPVLRRAASKSEQPEWAGCEWCPICAVSAMLRGEYHHLVAFLAEHAVAVVTILREAMAGVPVDPLGPDHDAPEAGSTGASVPKPYVPIPVTVRR